MILGELLQRVQTLYSSRVPNNSRALSFRHIYNKVISVRSTLLSQKSKHKQKIGDWNYQTISCIEMIDVKLHECPCAPHAGCETVKRSKHKIPKIMSDYNRNLIDYVMSIDGSKKYDFTNRSELLYAKGNKYTSNTSKYLLDKDYLYIYGNNIPKVVQLRALFENPIEAMEFVSMCPDEVGEECIDIFQMEFPLEASSIDTLVQLSIQELMLSYGQENRREQENSREE